MATLRLQLVRSVRRGLSGQDRDSEAAVEAALRSYRGQAAGREGRYGTIGLPHVRLGDGASQDLFAGGACGRETGTAVPPIGPLKNWASQRTLPRPAKQSFHELWAARTPQMTSRDQILADIRTALGRTLGASAGTACRSAVARSAIRIATYMFRLFVQRFEKLAGKVFVVPDIAAVVPQISVAIRWQARGCFEFFFFEGLRHHRASASSIRVHRSRCAARRVCGRRHRNHQRRLCSG